jgi:signal recognition particle subunit SRP54
MFESLQEGLSSALKTLRGKGKLSEGNMREGLALVEQSLLEADVSYQVAKDFMKKVAADAVGEKVLGSLDPTQQLVSVVYEKLVELMGPVDHSLHLQAGVTVLMLCGLQGSGKTTTCGKLGRLLLEQGKRPLLVAADLQRPAAIQQLHVIGEQLGIDVYSEPGAKDPVAVCQNAVAKAKKEDLSIVILDTAGRLHIDNELMAQLKQIDHKVGPHQVYLVVDGMTGQDAVNSAKAFNEALELDGVIVTKLDGDARGGAVLSVKEVTGVPVKYIGTGEHLDALQEFHPDRIAQRILGMGDILTLVEQAQQKFDQNEMAKQEERMRKGQFTLEDFRSQMTQTRKMGPINKLMGLIPGMGDAAKAMQGADTEGEMNRLGGIIDSMTPDERRNPRLIDQSRRRRIAQGAGVEPHTVNELVKQFEGMAHMMKQMASLSMMDRLRALRQMQSGGMMNPGAQLTRPKGNTGKRLTADERAKLKKQRDKELRKKKREQRGG